MPSGGHQKEVPWDLKISKDLSETVPPTEDEINFVRKFALAQAVGRKLMTELVVANLMKKAQQKTGK
jgi:glutaconate CoA-transferase subunit B